MSDKSIDIVVHGATGFTGQLIVEYLAQQYVGKLDIKLAIAGRNQSKLEGIKNTYGLPSDVAVIVADAGDAGALKALAAQARVVIAAAGPYQYYGSDLLAACVEEGTDYVDLCGEPNWMQVMIDQHQASAERSGARIVFSCGFDSIPFDLGILRLQNLAIERFGEAFAHVKGRVKSMQGGFSGGTMASMGASMKAAAGDPKIVELMMNAFALTPSRTGPEQPPSMQPLYDEALGSWVAPFIMATINSKNVHRTNALLNHLYGQGFLYDEMMLTGPGDAGEKAAQAVAQQMMQQDPNAGPKPGEGPSKEERENGFFNVEFHGKLDVERTLCVEVAGDLDPGYGCTSKMITESAMALLDEKLSTSGGVWTPASALGETLIDRLISQQVMSFKNF